jgi:hypothetical protein
MHNPQNGATMVLEHSRTPTVSTPQPKAKAKAKAKRTRIPDDPLAILNRDMDRSVPHYVSREKRPKVSKPVHPNLVAARRRTQLDFANGVDRQRCKYCKRVVVKGLEVCYFHGGASTVLARRRAKGLPIGQDTRTARRNLRDLFRKQKVPQGLAKVPAFIEAARIAVPGAFGLPRNTEQTPQEITTAILVARELAMAWVLAERGDTLAWTRAVAKAVQAGFGNGSRG